MEITPKSSASVDLPVPGVLAEIANNGAACTLRLTTVVSRAARATYLSASATKGNSFSASFSTSSAAAASSLVGRRATAVKV